MRKITVFTLLTILIITVAYSLSSIIFVHENFYLERAWDEIGRDQRIQWQDGEVSVVSLQGHSYAAKKSLLAQISRAFLWMSGNKAVRVRFHWELDGLLGPVTVYFHPVTKQVIGFDALY